LGIRKPKSHQLVRTNLSSCSACDPIGDTENFLRPQVLGIAVQAIQSNWGYGSACAIGCSVGDPNWGYGKVRLLMPTDCSAGDPIGGTEIPAPENLARAADKLQYGRSDWGCGKLFTSSRPLAARSVAARVIQLGIRKVRARERLS
jgi:hypothetical protein